MLGNVKPFIIEIYLRKATDLTIIHKQFKSEYVPAVKKTWQQVSSERLEYNPAICPCCKKATMRTVMEFDHRGPPSGSEQLVKVKSGKIPLAQLV